MYICIYQPPCTTLYNYPRNKHQLILTQQNSNLTHIMLTPSASNKEITIKEALNKKTKLQQLSDDLKIESDQHSLLKQKYQLLQSNLIQKSKFANDLIRKQQDDYDLKIAVLENQMESMNQVDVQQISVLKDQKIKIEKDYLEAMQVSSMLELKIKDLIACCKEHEETNQKLIDQAEKDVQTQTDLKESNKSLTDLFYVSQGELIYLQKTFDQDRRVHFTHSFIYI